MQITLSRSSFGTLLNLLASGVALIVLAGMGLTLLALAGYSVVKGTDVIYSTGYMVAHWTDEQAFPADAEFCKGLYCRRTDTTKKHVSGSERKQSEAFAHFCPEHKRSDYLFFLDLSHLGTFCWYVYGCCVFVATTCWYALAAAAVFGVGAGPAVLFTRGQARDRISGLWIGASILIGLLLAIPSCALYAWW